MPEKQQFDRRNNAKGKHGGLKLWIESHYALNIHIWQSIIGQGQLVIYGDSNDKLLPVAGLEQFFQGGDPSHTHTTSSQCELGAKGGASLKIRGLCPPVIAITG